MERTASRAVGEIQDSPEACAACGALIQIVSEYDRLCRGLLGALESRACPAESTALATIPDATIDVYEAGDDEPSPGAAGAGLRRLVVLSDSPDLLFRLPPLPGRRHSMKPARARR